MFISTLLHNSEGSSHDCERYSDGDDEESEMKRKESKKGEKGSCRVRIMIMSRSRVLCER